MAHLMILQPVIFLSHMLLINIDLFVIDWKQLAYSLNMFL